MKEEIVDKAEKLDGLRWLCLKSHRSGLDTVSTESDSDLVSDQLRYFRAILTPRR